MNNDTPRTDKYERDAAVAAIEYGKVWKPLDFARELERENARLRSLLREASSALDNNLLAAWCSDLEERIAAEVSAPNVEDDSRRGMARQARKRLA